MVLSDRSIREELASGRLRIEPLADGALQPSSIDLRLDRLFRVFKKTDRPHIDVREPCDD
ncbi:MAG: dCTP deaminase, partial [Dehalococcoidia bacterium]|nr:dCTP deaminase [Dehalococcoidia bacterium]